MSLCALGLSEAAADIREGRITSAELVTDCLARIEEVDADVQAWAFLDRDHALRQAEALDAHRQRRQGAGPAARRADRHQGHLRHRRHADRIRLAAVGRPHAAPRRRRRRPAARGRRRDHGQDRDHGIRLFPSRQDPEPARPRAHAGRLVERLGGGGRGRHGAGRDRLADQRLGDPAGGVLRRGRLQADARADLAHRRADAVAHARPCRRVRALGRGRGAARRDARRLRRGGSRHAAARAPALRGRGGERAAAAAALRLRALAGLEACRAGDARRPSPSWSRRSASRRARSSSAPASTTRSTCIGRSWKSRWRTISIATTSRAATSSARRCASSSSAGASTRRSTIRGAVAAIGPLNEALGGGVRRIRCHPDAGRAGRGAARARQHRQSGLLHDLDLSRRAGGHVAAAAVGGRAADRRAAGRPARQRCAPLAHRPLACQNSSDAERAAAAEQRPRPRRPSGLARRKGKAS